MATSRRFLLLSLLLYAATVSAFDCRQSDIKDKCDEYFKKGGISVILEDLKNVDQFTPEVEELFINAVSMVANDYVILTVIPSEHVALVDVGVSSGMVEVQFFILNPSGSIEVPTAFRAPELFLMMKLNDKKVEEMFGQAVKPIDPRPEPLAIPIWAIAIMGYIGVVILCALALYATRDWRKRMQEELEDDLGMSNMEKGKPMKDDDKKIPLDDMKLPPAEMKPEVTYSEAGVQTEFSPSKRRPSKEKPKQPDTPPSSNGHTVQATIESGSDDDSKARDDEAKSSGDEKASSGDEKVSVGDEKVSSGGEKVSSDDEKVAAADEKVSDGDEKVSVGDEKASVGDGGEENKAFENDEDDDESSANTQL